MRTFMAVCWLAMMLTVAVPSTGQTAATGRTLSEKQQADLGMQLKSGAGKRVVIYVPKCEHKRDRDERQAYADNLQAVFEADKWEVIRRNGNDTILQGDDGLLFVYAGYNSRDSWPDLSILKRPFDVVGIKYQVTPLHSLTDIYTDGVTASDLVIYVGENAQ